VLSVLESGEPQAPGQGAELLLTEGQFDQIERVMPLAGKPATAGESSS
jgi:hypothetical protein